MAMLDMIKAMQDPEFVKGLSDMPRQIAETLQRIEAKLDLLIWEVAGWDGNDIAAMLQNSDAANLQNSDDVNTAVTLDSTAEPVNINPVDPASYLDME